MTKARAVAGYLGSTVLLLAGAYLAWEVYVTLTSGFPLDATILAYGIPTRGWVYPSVVAILAAACFAGAIAVMVRPVRGRVVPTA